MDVAKKIRLSRILNPDSNRSIIVPIDHGLTVGPIPGLESSRQMSRWLLNDRIDTVLAHKGMIVRLAEHDLLRGRGVILHLNGMNMLARNSDDKELLTGMETAARLAVDGVSVQINFTGGNDAANWKLLGQVVDEAQVYGFPVLTMLYDKLPCDSSEMAAHRMRQLARVAVELGTDALKIAMPNNLEMLETIVESVHEDALIFLAGGEVADSNSLLRRLASAIGMGISGVCMGRNVFGNSNSDAFLVALSALVHGRSQASPIHREVVHVF